jgi:hypothetical protein
MMHTMFHGGTAIVSATRSDGDYLDSDDSSTSSSTLSAGAPPFHPFYEPVNLCIYNNGVPVLLLTSEKDRFDILHGIDDEALDEQFPPDACDAYELEAAEAFCAEMLHLSLLEEREEWARFTTNSYDNIFPKRWEARRAMGPNGRPRPAMHLIVPACHETKAVSKDRSIVSYSHHHHHSRTVMMMQQQAMKMNLRAKIEPRLAKHSMMMPQRPIQQPRKRS